MRGVEGLGFDRGVILANIVGFLAIAKMRYIETAGSCREHVRSRMCPSVFAGVGGTVG